MRAGLKSSLIMAQESSMSRSGSLGLRLVFSGPRPPARRDLRRARRPDPRIGLRLRRQHADRSDMTILTLGPTRSSR